MSNTQRALLIVSHDSKIAKLFETFTIEKIYSEPLKDLTHTYIYVAAAHSSDATILTTGYIGKIKSTTISQENDKWVYKFVVADILATSTTAGLPRSTREIASGDVFEADLSVHLSPPELEGTPNPELKINNFDESRVLTITDAIERIATTYNVPPSNVSISIIGSANNSKTTN